MAKGVILEKWIIQFSFLLGRERDLRDFDLKSIGIHSNTYIIFKNIFLLIIIESITNIILILITYCLKRCAVYRDFKVIGSGRDLDKGVTKKKERGKVFYLFMFEIRFFGTSGDSMSHSHSWILHFFFIRILLFFSFTCQSSFNFPYLYRSQSTVFVWKYNRLVNNSFQVSIHV